MIARSPMDDARLVAFLDGELDASEKAAVDDAVRSDPEIAARLKALSAGLPDFANAFDALLASAPQAKLMSMLAAAEAETSARPRVTARRLGGFARLAAALVFMVAGGAVGFGVAQYWHPAGSERQGETNWRAAVADYLTLYTRDTLAAIPDDPALRGSELANVDRTLALGLTPETVALPDLQLKRAQLFQFNGKPLAQIAYLTEADGPVAFCVIQNGKPDAPAAFEEREGRNIVFWQKGGHGFMVIGTLPRATMEDMATTLGGRFS